MAGEGGGCPTPVTVLLISPLNLHPPIISKMSPEIPKKMKALRVNSGNQQVLLPDSADILGNTIPSRRSMSPLLKAMKLS